MDDLLADPGAPGGGRTNGRSPAPLDDVDRRILAELQVDGRMSVRTLAERVRVSRANAYARLERLRRDRVITGFQAVVDPARAGLTTSAYVTLTLRQHTWRDLRAALADIPEVRHIALVGGEFDVVLLVRTIDNAALRDLVLERIPQLPGVVTTRTFLVFEDAENPSPSPPAPPTATRP